MTILDQINKFPKELISKGYSQEMKYKVKADKNYFLKISPLSFFKGSLSNRVDETILVKELSSVRLLNSFFSCWSK